MKILLASGGTGGHVCPAMGLAEVFSDHHEVVMVIGQSYIEDTLLKCTDKIKIERITVSRLPEAGNVSWISFLKSIWGAFRASLKIVRQFRPDVVIGFGSYASVPVVLAARWAGLPTLIHEQNVIPGKANRLLSKWVRGIAISFPQTQELWNFHSCVRITGNPSILRFRNAECGMRNAEFTPHSEIRIPHFEEGRFTLLIMGGSQGAHSINELMIQVMPKWLKRHPDQERYVQMIHLTGQRDFEKVKHSYQYLRMPVYMAPFNDQMGQFYQMSHLVVGRAGATSLSEFAYFGLPSILIPYPYAGAHQFENAKIFAQEGASVVLDQKGVTSDEVVTILHSLVTSKEKLSKMQEANLHLVIPDAEKRFFELIREVL